jgi:hypothetical protein
MKQHTRSSGNRVAGLLLMTGVTAFACSFNPDVPPPPSTALFSGTVTSITVDTNNVFPMNRVTFHVIETWKGTNTVTKTVLTGMGGGDCGYDYLVYAMGSADSLYTSITLPTFPLSDPRVPYYNLGEGQTSDVPLLRTAKYPGGMALSWRTNWSNFHLEASETLEPSSWVRVTNVQTNDNYYVATDDMTSSRRFFRLAR